MGLPSSSRGPSSHERFSPAFLSLDVKPLVLDKSSASSSSLTKPGSSSKSTTTTTSTVPRKSQVFVQPYKLTDYKPSIHTRPHRNAHASSSKRSPSSQHQHRSSHSPSTPSSSLQPSQASLIAFPNAQEDLIEEKRYQSALVFKSTWEDIIKRYENEVVEVDDEHNFATGEFFKLKKEVVESEEEEEGEGSWEDESGEEEELEDEDEEGTSGEEDDQQDLPLEASDSEDDDPLGHWGEKAGLEVQIDLNVPKTLQAQPEEEEEEDWTIENNPDLKAFLEAEKKRREKLGEIQEEEEGQNGEGEEDRKDLGQPKTPSSSKQDHKPSSRSVEDTKPRRRFGSVSHYSTPDLSRGRGRSASMTPSLRELNRGTVHLPISQAGLIDFTNESDDDGFGGGEGEEEEDPFSSPLAGLTPDNYGSPSSQARNLSLAKLRLDQSNTPSRASGSGSGGRGIGLGGGSPRGSHLMISPTTPSHAGSSTFSSPLSASRFRPSQLSQLAYSASSDAAAAGPSRKMDKGKGRMMDLPEQQSSTSRNQINSSSSSTKKLSKDHDLVSSKITLPLQKISLSIASSSFPRSSTMPELQGKPKDEIKVESPVTPSRNPTFAKRRSLPQKLQRSRPVWVSPPPLDSSRDEFFDSTAVEGLRKVKKEIVDQFQRQPNYDLPEGYSEAWFQPLHTPLKTSKSGRVIKPPIRKEFRQFSLAVPPPVPAETSTAMEVDTQMATQALMEGLLWQQQLSTPGSETRKRGRKLNTCESCQTAGRDTVHSCPGRLKNHHCIYNTPLKSAEDEKPEVGASGSAGPRRGRQLKKCAACVRAGRSTPQSCRGRLGKQICEFEEIGARKRKLKVEAGSGSTGGGGLMTVEALDVKPADVGPSLPSPPSPISPAIAVRADISSPKVDVKPTTNSPRPTYGKKSVARTPGPSTAKARSIGPSSSSKPSRIRRRRSPTMEVDDDDDILLMGPDWSGWTEDLNPLDETPAGSDISPPQASSYKRKAGPSVVKDDSPLNKRRRPPPILSTKAIDLSDMDISDDEMNL